MKSILPPFFKLFLFIASTFSVVGCSSFSTVDYEKFNQPEKDILITNTNVLSENGEFMLPNQNIYIQNGQITTITSNPINTTGALIIDGQDKYVIPGLIDSHVHLQKSENDLLVYLAQGITHVREMSGNDEHHEWKVDIDNGRAGPSIEVSSEKISSKSGLWGFINELFWNRINVSGEKEVLNLVESLQVKGYANAKISSDLSKEMYLEVTQVAKLKGLKIAGHIPSAISFNEFIESSHTEIAHIEELVKIMNKEFGYFTTANGHEFLEYVKTRSHKIAKDLKSNHISVGTTYWYMQSIPKQVHNLPALINDLDFSFTNPQRVSEWMPEKNDFAINHAHLKEWWPIFAKANELVLQALIENDVIILVGTDAMTTLVVPGISMHQELEALVNAGMSNTQAIRNATIVPAKWMGEKVGKLSSGYEADLLILNSDPLKDIKATANINAVVSDGRLYNRETLKSMLDSVRSKYAN